MSLTDPSKKMSKSDPKGDIFLKDPLPLIRKKIMSAVTDSGSEIKFDPENKPGIANLLTIYAALKETTPEEAEKLFVGFRYGDFKKAVADAVEEELASFKARYEKIIADKSYVSVLEEGAKKASLIADKTLHRVQKAVGLLQLND